MATIVTKSIDCLIISIHKGSFNRKKIIIVAYMKSVLMVALYRHLYNRNRSRPKRSLEHVQILQQEANKVKCACTKEPKTK